MLLLGSSGARAQLAPDEVPLGDLVEVLQVGRDLLAVDASGGGSTRVRLERGERVRWRGQQGGVAVVLTDRRVLAVSDRSGSWQHVRYRRTEAPPPAARLGDRVALVTLATRVLGYDGGSGNLVESGIGPHERLVGTATGANVAIAVTSRRALGLSPFVGGFFATPIRLGERIESVKAGANLATVRTSQRLLIFRARGRTWEERRLPLS